MKSLSTKPFVDSSMLFPIPTSNNTSKASVRSKRFRSSPSNMMNPRQSLKIRKSRSKSRLNIRSKLSSEFLPIVKESTYNNVDQRISLRKQMLFKSFQDPISNSVFSIPSLITSYSSLTVAAKSSHTTSKSNICGLYSFASTKTPFLLFPKSNIQISLICSKNLELPGPKSRFITIHPPWIYIPGSNPKKNKVKTPTNNPHKLIFHSFQLSEKPETQFPVSRHLEPESTFNFSDLLFFEKQTSKSITSHTTATPNGIKRESNFSGFSDGDGNINMIGELNSSQNSNFHFQPLKELDNPIPTQIIPFYPLFFKQNIQNCAVHAPSTLTALSSLYRNFYSWTILGISTSLEDFDTYKSFKSSSFDLETLKSWKYLWAWDSVSFCLICLGKSSTKQPLKLQIQNVISSYINDISIRQRCLVFPVENLKNNSHIQEIIFTNASYLDIYNKLKIDKQMSIINIFLIR